MMNNQNLSDKPISVKKKNTNRKTSTISTSLRSCNLSDIIHLVTVEKIEKRDADYHVHVQGHDTPVRLTMKELMSRRLFQLRIFEATLRPPYIEGTEQQWLLALSDALRTETTKTGSWASEKSGLIVIPCDHS